MTDLDKRTVRQTVHRPGLGTHTTYWYRFVDALADLEAILAADPGLDWGYVVDGERLERRHRGR